MLLVPPIIVLCFVTSVILESHILLKAPPTIVLLPFQHALQLGSILIQLFCPPNIELRPLNEPEIDPEFAIILLSLPPVIVLYAKHPICPIILLPLPPKIELSNPLPYVEVLQIKLEKPPTIEELCENLQFYLVDLHL